MLNAVVNILGNTLIRPLAESEATASWLLA